MKGASSNVLSSTQVFKETGKVLEGQGWWPGGNSLLSSHRAQEMFRFKLRIALVSVSTANEHYPFVD